jgi:hypothetical protein
MPAPNKIELEVSGDLQNSVDNLMSDINASFDKTKVKSSAPALAYMDILLEIKNASAKTIKDCNEVCKLQKELSDQTDINVFLQKWVPCKDKFATIYAFVAAGVKKNREVPPISEKLKAEIPPETLKLIEKARTATVEWRVAEEKTFKITMKNHNTLNGVIKSQIKLKEQKAAANDGAVHPAPSNGPVMQPPLSSSYGSQQQASARAAANANRSVGPGANPQNPNAKK